MRYFEILTETQPAKPKIMFHGTSLVQFDKMRNDGFMVKDLYIGDSQENITDHYAEKQSIKDDSYPVTLFIDCSKLSIKSDIHKTYDDEVLQIGQFIYTGPLNDALVKAVAYDLDTSEDVTLPLSPNVPLPLPLHYK